MVGGALTGGSETITEAVIGALHTPNENAHLTRKIVERLLSGCALYHLIADSPN